LAIQRQHRSAIGQILTAGYLNLSLFITDDDETQLRSVNWQFTLICPIWTVSCSSVERLSSAVSTVRAGIIADNFADEIIWNLER